MVLSGRFSHRVLVAAAVVVSGALVAGCGGSSHSGSSHKTVSLTHAADISANAAGYKLTMTMHEQVGAQTVDMNASGSFNTKPLDGSMDMTIAAAGQTIPAKVVLSNGTLYEQLPSSLMSQLPGDKSWLSMNLSQLGSLTKLPGLGSLMSSDSEYSDPGQYMDYLKAASDGSVKDLGQATVDGVQTTHYSAEVDISKLPSAVPAAARSAVEQLVAALKTRFKEGNMPMDVWIDQSDLIRKVQMGINETVDGHAVTGTITEQISAYGTQPAPTVPSSAETLNLLSLLKKSGG
jgi:hypothetical protein